MSSDELWGWGRIQEVVRVWLQTRPPRRGRRDAQESRTRSQEIQRLREAHPEWYLPVPDIGDGPRWFVLPPGELKALPDSGFPSADVAMDVAWMLNRARRERPDLSQSDPPPGFRRIGNQAQLDQCLAELDPSPATRAAGAPMLREMNTRPSQFPFDMRIVHTAGQVQIEYRQEQARAA